MTRKSYEERLERCENPLLRKLFKIIITKQSNLCVALDFETLQETLDCIDRIGKHVCIIKTHVAHYTDSTDLGEKLKKLYAKKKEHNFLLFEDRKLYDEPKVVAEEYRRVYINYADLVTFAPVREKTFEAFAEVVKNTSLPEDEPRGLLPVIETSFGDPDCMLTNTEVCLKYAAKFSEICVGIIAQQLQVPDDCQMIKATPGVHLHQTASGAQRWNPPAHVIKRGSDIIIVGRGIIASEKDQLEKVAIQYKEAGWEAYLDDLNGS